MVYQQKNKSAIDAAYVDTTAPVKASVKAEVQKLTDYFALLDGSPLAAARFQQAFKETFHPDVRIEFPGSNLDYAAAVECIQAAVDKGGYADLLNIVENGDGSATMTICNNVPGLKDDVTRQVAYFKDGKVIRVHAIEQDVAQFGKVLAAIQRCIPSNIVNRYTDFISCFDGSPDAYSRALPIIDELFTPELTISTGDDTMDLNEFKEWAESFSKQRNVAKLESIEPTADGIRVVILNTVDGVDQDPVAQLGTVEDGKIVAWRADLMNEAGFDRLVTSVAANQDGMAGNIQRLKDYLAALGSGDFSRFEPHIDRVLSKDIVWENDDGEKMEYDEIIALLRDKFIPNKCYPVLESVEANEDGKSLTVVINNHLPGDGEAGDATRQVLYYGDDDRLHRLVSSGLYNTCQRVEALESK